MSTAKDKFWKVNFQYPAPNGALRSGSQIESAPDASTATKQAEEKIKANHQIYKIGATVQW